MIFTVIPSVLDQMQSIALMPLTAVILIDSINLSLSCCSISFSIGSGALITARYEHQKVSHLIQDKKNHDQSNPSCLVS